MDEFISSSLLLAKTLGKKLLVKTENFDKYWAITNLLKQITIHKLCGIVRSIYGDKFSMFFSFKYKYFAKIS